MESFHKKKVFLLIDEYDKRINNLMQDNNERLCNELHQIAVLITSIILACSKGQDSVKQIIITGIFNTLIVEDDSGLNNVLQCDLNDTTFNEFFGLSEHEIEEQVLKVVLVDDTNQEKQLKLIQQNLKV